MIYAQCKTCLQYSQRNYVNMQLYEYSTARFFEQFFYNDKLKVKDGVFNCGHGSHPLRDYIIEFLVDQTKIRFCFTPIDTYHLETLSLKSTLKTNTICTLTGKRVKKLIILLEVALYHYQHDQVDKLQAVIAETIAQFDLTNAKKFCGTNMPIYVDYFKKVSEMLQALSDSFEEFQEEAKKELCGIKTEILSYMFVEQKILVTFLGYQRVIDEFIQQLALIMVIARRRALVLEKISNKDLAESCSVDKTSDRQYEIDALIASGNNKIYGATQQMIQIKETKLIEVTNVDDQSQSMLKANNDSS